MQEDLTKREKGTIELLEELFDPRIEISRERIEKIIKRYNDEVDGYRISYECEQRYINRLNALIDAYTNVLRDICCKYGE